MQHESAKVELMLICNDYEMARYAVINGVDRIFLDLEIHGKKQRQASRDTVISGHEIKDIRSVKEAIAGAELLVRLNPLHNNTETEVEQAISAGADSLMLPMFDTADQLRQFLDLVDGRVRVIPLVETPKAVTNFNEIRWVEGVAEFYFGLNDLHIALGMKFMFELLIDGTMERMAAFCHEATVPFGFGGIARMDEGLIPGKLVLAEHLRLGSSIVILSRTFHRASKTIKDLKDYNFATELQRLRRCQNLLEQRNENQINTDHQILVAQINNAIR
jgi:hypothetical protein